MASKKKRPTKPRREHPRTIDPPQPAEETLMAARDACFAMRQAVEGFQESTDRFRRQGHLRNFVENAAAVTQILHKLRTSEVGRKNYDAWYQPIQAHLRADNLASCFWALRVKAFHVGLTRIKLVPQWPQDASHAIPHSVIYAPPEGPPLVAVLLNTPEGPQFHRIEGLTFLATVEGTPRELESVDLSILMDRHATGIELVLLDAWKAFSHGKPPIDLFQASADDIAFPSIHVSEIAERVRWVLPPDEPHEGGEGVS